MAYKPKVLEAIEGGTGAANTPTSGKALIGNGSAFVTSTASFPATAGATGTILRSDGTNWVATTSTYPATNAISTLVYASASNVLGALATANNGLLVTSSTGVPSILAGPGATGRVLQSNAAAAPSFSTATFPSVATGTGTILRADGTNWVATTATYPATTTANQLLVSTATNVVGGLTAGSTGQVLTGVTGAVPAFSATPAVTSITLSSGTALSTYVVGTWTPVLAFGGASVGITYSSQNGQYTQIGNVVFFTFVLDMTSKGSSTGAATITGLPVTSGSTGNNCMSSFTFQRLTLTALYTDALFQVVNSGTTLTLFQQGSAQAYATLADTNFANNTTIFCEGFYRTS